MKLVQELGNQVVAAQGRVRALQAKLFEIGQRETALAQERQAAERELAGALGRMGAWQEAQRTAEVAENQAAAEKAAVKRVAAAKRAAAKSQGGPTAAPEPEKKD